MIKAYVISLKNPTNLLEDLSKHGINPIWSEGINGNKMSDIKIRENTTPFYGLFGPKSIIAIALSHMKVWKTFLETGDQYAVVFEDDVVLMDNFQEMFHVYMNYVPSDFDILYLGCVGCSSPLNIQTFLAFVFSYKRKHQKINEYINKPKVSTGFHSYVISRKGAKILLNNLEKNIKFHVDAQALVLANDDIINIYSVNPLIAYQTSTDGISTSSNSSSKHPYLINYILSNIYLEKGLTWNYLFTSSIVRIGNLNITVFSFIFLILGIILALIKVPTTKIIIFYLLLFVIPDIIVKNVSKMDIIIHFFLFVIPSLFFFCYNKNI